MRLQPILWASTVLLQSACAIFSDEAFHIDYHHALLGIPLSQATSFHKPQSSSNASLLYTLSEKGWIGAINPKDGNILWRQALGGDVEHGDVGSLVLGDGQIVTGRGEQAACWDALDGKLRWEFNAGVASVMKGVQFAPGSTPAAQDALVLVAKDTGLSVMRLAGDDGSNKWTHADSAASAASDVSIAASDKSVFVIEKSQGLLGGNKIT